MWLLRFPVPGEAHLKETAIRWAGQAVADRIIFTDVVQKYEHIQRGRIADLFLDTTEVSLFSALNHDYQANLFLYSPSVMLILLLVR